MSKKSRIVAVIPVKEISERVPNKNFRKFTDEGMSLLDLLISRLIKIDLIDHIYISTDKKDLKIEKNLKLSTISRDTKYCNNITPWSDVIYNVISSLPEEDDTHIMWCHTTSPLFDNYLSALDKYLKLLDNGNYNSLVTVERAKEFLIDEKGRAWNYNFGIWHKYSQELPNLFKVTGSLFINKLSEMKKTRYVINNNPYLFEIEPLQALDIDNIWQFKLAKLLYQNRSNLMMNEL